MTDAWGELERHPGHCLRPEPVVGSNREILISFCEGKAMERHTFDGTMRAFRNRKPFQPFTVAMVDGDRLEIDHPEAIVAPVIFDYDGVSQIIGDLSGQRTP